MASEEFKVEIAYLPPPNWDKLLFEVKKETSICQSTYWARVLQKLEGAKPHFITVRDENRRALGLCLIVRRPFKKHGRLKNLLWYLECIDGPVILQPDQAFNVTEEILRSAILFAKRSLITHIQIIPARTNKWADDLEITSVYQRYGFAIRRWGTYLVDLEKGEEELFSNLKHSARKCIRKCKKMGVKVEKIKNLEEFRDIFWKSYAKFEEEFKRPVRPFSSITWEEDRDNLYHYFVAKDTDGRVLAVLGMYIFNGVATEIISSISSYAYKEKIPAQDLLHWEMMLEAKRLGCEIFDLAGVNPDPKDPKEIGIRRFKEKWGGRYIEYHTYKKEMLISKILEWGRRYKH
jgi:lipid II:glycine glycyltransferase (peptidoglycan interpeptide bridge formation enzyme)